MINGAIPTRIDDMNNNCVLVAMREVTGRCDEEIFRAVMRHGYKPHKGMYPSDYHDALRYLGFELGPQQYVWDFSKMCGAQRTARGMTINGVLKHLRKGVYLVNTRGHVFVVRNGRLLDLNYRGKPALGRAIVSVTQVLNAFVPAVVSGLKVHRRNTRRFGTRTWRAYEEAIRAIQAGAKTREQLLAMCKEYNAIDLAWDLKRGNIIEV